MEQVKVNGIVLSAMPMNEYDKRLVILTKERGKITAFAKGARRTNNSFLAASRPFSFGEFSVYEGRNAYSLVNANITNYFPELAADIDSTCYGFYFMELADYFGREGIGATDTLQLLYITLKALIKGTINNRLIRCIYELKTFVFDGSYPSVFACAKCGKEKQLQWYAKDKFVVYCSECKSKEINLDFINDSTLYTLQYIISQPVNKLYTFTVDDKVLTDLEHILSMYIKRNIGRQFKSLEVLETLY